MDWTTGLEHWTHIFLVLYILWLYLLCLCLQVAFCSLNVRYNYFCMIFLHDAEWVLVVMVRYLLVLLHWIVACSIQVSQIFIALLWLNANCKMIWEKCKLCTVSMLSYLPTSLYGLLILATSVLYIQLWQYHEVHSNDSMHSWTMNYPGDLMCDRCIMHRKLTNLST